MRKDEIMIKIYNKKIIYPVISDRTCDNESWLDSNPRPLNHTVNTGQGITMFDQTILKFCILDLLNSQWFAGLACREFCSPWKKSSVRRVAVLDIALRQMHQFQKASLPDYDVR